MINPDFKPKSGHTFKAYEYEVAQMFPSGNKLGIHVLRFLGISNDLAFLQEWLKSTLNEKQDGVGLLMVSGRGFFLSRVLCAFFHELLDCLDEVVRDQEFKTLEKNFEPNCRFALNRLIDIRKNEDTEFSKILEKTRNKTAFHFDRGAIEQGLNTLRRLSKDPKYRFDSSLVIQFEKGNESNNLMRAPYAPLADLTRDVQGLSILGEGGFGKVLDKLLTSLKDFDEFLGGFFHAYVKERNLVDSFRPSSEYE